MYSCTQMCLQTGGLKITLITFFYVLQCTFRDHSKDSELCLGALFRIITVTHRDWLQSAFEIPRPVAYL